MKHFLVFQLFGIWLEGNLRYRVLSHTDHTRILRIIVDETQKERRLNWTFVDKFFVGMFLEERSSDEWEDERSMDVIQQNLVLDNIGIGTCSLSGYISSYLAAKYYFLNHITMLNVFRLHSPYSWEMMMFIDKYHKYIRLLVIFNI